MTKQLINYLPTRYKEILDVVSLFDILQEELDLVYEYAEKYKKNLFLKTADDDILDKYLSIIGLSGETTEKKRQNIIAKLSALPPFSLEMIEDIVKIYTLTANLELQNNTISVFYTTSDGEEVDKPLVLTEIYNLLPANIAVNFIYVYAIYSSLSNNMWEELLDLSWCEVKYGE